MVARFQHTPEGDPPSDWTKIALVFAGGGVAVGAVIGAPIGYHLGVGHASPNASRPNAAVSSAPTSSSRASQEITSGTVHLSPSKSPEVKKVEGVAVHDSQTAAEAIAQKVISTYETEKGKPHAHGQFFYVQPSADKAGFFDVTAEAIDALNAQGKPVGLITASVTVGKDEHGNLDASTVSSAYIQAGPYAKNGHTASAYTLGIFASTEGKLTLGVNGIAPGNHPWFSNSYGYPEAAGAGLSRNPLTAENYAVIAVQAVNVIDQAVNNRAVDHAAIPFN